MDIAEPLEGEWGLAWQPAWLTTMVCMGESWKVQGSSLHSSICSSHIQELSLQDHHGWLRLETWGPSWLLPLHHSHPTSTMSAHRMECPLNLSLPTTSTFLSSDCHLSPSPLQKPPHSSPDCSSVFQTSLHTMAERSFSMSRSTSSVLRNITPLKIVRIKRNLLKDTVGHENRRATVLLWTGTWKSCCSMTLSLMLESE